MKLGALLLGILLSAAACGGGDSSDVDAAGAPDATVFPDAGPCNTVTGVATAISGQAVAEEAPTPQGGTIEDGTYVVTADMTYTGVGGQTGATGMTQATSVNVGGTYDYVDTAADPPIVTHGTYQTSGTDTILVLQTCPNNAVLGFSRYTATPTTFTLYDVTNQAAIGALTFTLQQK